MPSSPARQINANVYVNGSVIPSVASVVLPDLNVTTEEFSSLGMAGAVELPGVGQIEAMEATIRPRSNVRELENGISYNQLTEIEVRVALSQFDASAASITHTGRNVTMRVLRKGRSSDEIEKDRESGPEITLSVIYYREQLADGVVLHEIDPFNNVFIHNGVDVLEGVRALL